LPALLSFESCLKPFYSFLIQSAKLARDKAGERIEQLDRTLQQETTARLDALARLEEVKKEREALHAELKQQREICSDLERQIEDSRDSNEHYKQEILLITNELQELRNNFESANANYQQSSFAYEAKFVELHEVLGRLTDDIGHLQTTSQALKAERTQLQQSLNNNNEEIQRLENEKNSFSQQLEESHRRNEESQATITDLNTEIQRLREELERERDQHRNPPLPNPPVPDPLPIANNYNNDDFPMADASDDEQPLPPLPQAQVLLQPNPQPQLQQPQPQLQPQLQLQPPPQPAIVQGQVPPYELVSYKVSIEL
jgi:myosin heavy subunit